MILLLILISGAYAVDSSFGAHISGEIAPDGTFQLHPGIDFRFIGGRGIIGSEFTVGYYPSNSRGYLDSDGSFEVSEVLMASAYALFQLSWDYGDMAVYMGPGTSLYYMPQEVTPSANSTLLEDNLIHWKTGFLYTLYPAQFFAEAEIDIFFDSFKFDIQHPHISLGVSFLK